MGKDKEKTTSKQRMYDLKKKSAGAAAGASVLIPGLGHFYLGKYGKGIVLLLLCMGLWLILMGWIINIIAIWSAYDDAHKYNELLKLELGL